MTPKKQKKHFLHTFTSSLDRLFKTLIADHIFKFITVVYNKVVKFKVKTKVVLNLCYP